MRPSRANSRITRHDSSTFRSVLVGITCWLALCLNAPAQPVVGPNLIVNGDVELGPGSSNGSVVAIPGWSTTGDFTATQYGAPTGFPTALDPGPPSRGQSFFAGGPSTGISTASQTVDFTSHFNLIDGGSVPFELSGYFGGFATQGDHMELTATFRNSSAAPLGAATIGAVSAVDRGGNTGLLFRSTTGTLPAGTRDVLLTMTATRLDGVYNDGYADNLSLNIAIPEPAASAALAAAFTMAFAWFRRRWRNGEGEGVARGTSRGLLWRYQPGHRPR